MTHQAKAQGVIFFVVLYDGCQIYACVLINESKRKIVAGDDYFWGAFMAPLLHPACAL